MSLIFDKNIHSEFDLECGTLSRLCLAENTPRALTVFIMLKYKMFSDIISLTTNPLDYLFSNSGSQKFKSDRLVTDFLRKSPNIPLGIDTKQKAEMSFYESEFQCEAATAKLRSLDPYSKDFQLILDVKERISEILGPVTKRVLRNVERNMRFGPGVTTSISGNFSPSEKFNNESPHLTSNLYPFYKSILGDLWHENAKTPTIVEGNRFITVPKNALTDRGICVEPDLNIFVQLGIGAVLKSKLASTGNPIDDQSINRKFAQDAQEKLYSTIDLSSASDNISAYLVYLLLDEQWFHLLDLPRSHKTLINGSYHMNHKFSSMGNGYTFELETLIFLAICRAVIPQEYWNDIRVFGDDIIVPQRYSSEVLSLLDLCGFVVNRAKSCLAGSFFESCGADFFNSVPVRPFFAFGKSDGIPYALQLANKIRDYAFNGVFCDIKYKKVWMWLVKQLPPIYQQCKVPISFGDLGLHDVAEPIKHEFWDAYIYTFIRVRESKKSSRSIGYLICALSRVGSEEPIMTRNREVVKGLFGKPKITSTVSVDITSNLAWG